MNVGSVNTSTDTLWNTAANAASTAAGAVKNAAKTIDGTFDTIDNAVGAGVKKVEEYVCITPQCYAQALWDLFVSKVKNETCNMLYWGTSSLGKAPGMAVSYLSDWAMSGINTASPSIAANISNIGSIAQTNITQLGTTLTQSIAPKALEAALIENTTPFYITDLVGPVAFMGFFSYKSAQNMGEALGNFGKMCCGGGLESSRYKRGPVNGEFDTDQSRCGHALNGFANVIFSAMWGVGVYGLNRGIHNALVSAGNDAASADQITKTITATLTVAAYVPQVVKLCKFVKGFFSKKAQAPQPTANDSMNKINKAETAKKDNKLFFDGKEYVIIPHN